MVSDSSTPHKDRFVEAGFETSSNRGQLNTHIPFPPTPFVFITSTESSRNGRPPSEARKVVRQHVITKYHNLKRSLPSCQKPWTKLSAEAAKGCQVGKFRLEGHDRHGKKRAAERKGEPRYAGGVLDTDIMKFPEMLPRNFRSANFIDPFGATALELGRCQQELIQHFKANIPNSIHPIKSYTKHSQLNILSMAVADEALLHAILAFAMFNRIAFHSSRNVPPSPSTGHDPAILFHKTKAMHIMNKKLDSSAVSDAMIATTLILQLQYPWIESSTESDIHFSALTKLVQQRGGLENLPVPLSTPISFYDRRRSILKGTKPHFPLIAPPIFPSDLTIRHPPTSSVFSHSPSSLSPLLGTTLCTTLTDLHHFTAFIAYYRFRGSSFSEHTSTIFESWNTSLEYRLLSFVDTRPDTSQSARNFLEATRIAAILWMSTGLWSFPLSTSLVRANVQKLVDALEPCDVLYWCSCTAYIDLMIWMSVVGACCSPAPGRLRMSLVGKLQAVVAAQGVGRDDLVGALKRIIWMDGAYEPGLPQLWEEVIGLCEGT